MAEPINAIYPEDLDDELAWILGRPNFTCGHLAAVLRKSGAQIATRAEAEQAAVIHWMLKLYFRHGAAWREHAAAEVERLRNGG